MKCWADKVALMVCLMRVYFWAFCCSFCLLLVNNFYSFNMDPIAFEGKNHSELSATYGIKNPRSIRKKGFVTFSVHKGDGTSLNGYLPFTKELSRFIETPQARTTKVSISTDSGEQSCFLLEAQFDSVKNYLMDLQFVSLDKKEVYAQVPVKLENLISCPGIKLGGKLNFMNSTLKCKCDPQNIPEYISIDLSTLRIGHKITTKDVDLQGASVKGVIDIVAIMGKKKKDEE